METYSDMQLDALRELANIGSGTAATALSSLLGRPIDVSVPNALALPLADAVDAAGPADAEVTAVVLPIFGDIEAVVLMLFHRVDAESICTLLGVEPGSEVGVSALGEVGNILGSSYVGALGMMTGLELEPRPPQVAERRLGSLVEDLAGLAAGASAPTALLLDSALSVDDTDVRFAFMLLLPDTSAGVHTLLERLGLE
jgi:chemotaxis protein CheC